MMKQQVGKTVLVTGSTDGIGKQTALELAKMGATVIIHGRDESRVMTAIEEIQNSIKSAKLEAATADLWRSHGFPSSPRQVR